MTSLARVAVIAVVVAAAPRAAVADPIGLKWAQPSGTGSPVVITYSYSNLFDGTFLLLSPSEMRAAAEESLRLWASVAPLHFVERRDSGPPPSDAPYSADGHPQIRIGHHEMTEWAHAYFPAEGDGLAGDVHLASGAAWRLRSDRWDFLEVLTHELGHSLGLPHLFDCDAIMNPSFPQRYNGLGTAYLLPADVDAIQSVYGAGRGSVEPLATPEPSTLLLVGIGIGLAARRGRRRRFHAAVTARLITSPCSRQRPVDGRMCSSKPPSTPWG